MPATARVKYLKSDIVKNPPLLPIPMYSGDIDWSLTFEGFPIGNLQYTNIAESDLPAFEKAYNILLSSTKIYLKIYGIDFEVKTYGYDRKSALWKDSILINTYTVSIELKSRWEELATQDIKVFTLVPLGSTTILMSDICLSANLGYSGIPSGIPYSGINFNVAIPANADKNYTIKIADTAKDYARINGCYVSFTDGVCLKPLGSGGTSWSLSNYEVVTDGKNTVAASLGYNSTQLSWGTGTNKNIDADTNTTFTLQEPLIQTLDETDEDLEKPPSDAIVIRNMASCHDNSGPKKTMHRTVAINGSTDTEETWIWGFEFTAEQICLPNGLPFTDQPENFWSLIEYQKTKYKYEKISGLTLDVKAKDPNPIYANTDLSGFVYLVVPPAYDNFVSFSGESGKFDSNALYLTGSTTTGTRRFRFVQESDDKLITLNSEDPDYQLCQFITVPSESATGYSLINSRTLYKTQANLPFSVQWKVYGELDPSIQEKIDAPGGQISSTGKVGLLYPDPNFVEPMAILTETKRSSSFAFTPNPVSTPDAPDTPYATGEYSFTITNRTLVNSNQYKEKISEYSTQNSGFSELIAKVTYRDVSGKIPEATTRKSDWEKNDGSQGQSSTAATPQFYYMTSDHASLIPQGQTKNYPLATTYDQALTAATTELRISEMQQNQVQRSVFSFYPNMRDGDRVVTEYDRFKAFGDWRIVNAGFKLSFRGISTKYGLVPICQSAPISISLGLSRQRNITVQNQDSPTDSTSSTDPKMIVTGGETQTLGEVLINSPNLTRY
jgi:hypothetical protein